MSLLHALRIFLGFDDDKDTSVSNLNLVKKKTPLATGTVLLEPRNCTAATKVADYMKSGQQVLVNLTHLNAKDGKNFFDRACGIVYALNGSMQKINGTIFLFSPSNVTVTDLRNVPESTSPGEDKNKNTAVA